MCAKYFNVNFIFLHYYYFFIWPTSKNRRLGDVVKQSCLWTALYLVLNVLTAYGELDKLFDRWYLCSFVSPQHDVIHIEMTRLYWRAFCGALARANCKLQASTSFSQMHVCGFTPKSLDHGYPHGFTRESETHWGDGEGWV